MAIEVKLDRINQSFAVATEPLRIGGGQSYYRGELDDLRIHGRDLEAAEVEILAEPKTVSSILKMPTESRNKAQRHKLARYFLDYHAPEQIQTADHRLTELRRQRRTFFESLPTVMVMQEMEQPRETHVLIRGQYDQPGELVRPAVPTIFPAMPANAPNNRLGFARWLFGSDHPLTARVAVNRFWQQYFGQGLVATSEDFGAQAENPSHPELLDWLATEFVRLDWDIKAMQKLIVIILPTETLNAEGMARSLPVSLLTGLRQSPITSTDGAIRKSILIALFGAKRIHGPGPFGQARQLGVYHASSIQNLTAYA